MNCTTRHNNWYKIETFRTSGLSEKELNVIVEKIKKMYAWFDQAATEVGIRLRLCQHAEAHIDILSDISTDECRGFSVYYTEQYNNSCVIFRGGTIVLDRSQGLYRALLCNSVSFGRHDFVVAMTQNPRVYETLRSLAPSSVVYPSVDENPTKTIRGIAKAFCKAPGVDLDTMIVRGVYKTIRKDREFMTATDPYVEKFFKENLGEDDGFFVVVPLH
jgi:hypothetical protein